MNFSSGNGQNNGKLGAGSFRRGTSNGSFRRIFKSWKKEPADLRSMGDAKLVNEHKFFGIDELISITKFTRTEIQYIYRDFKQKCPSGILTEKNLKEIYSYYFPCGDCTIFAKHLFSALAQHNTIKSNSIEKEKPTEINFKEFILTLSTVMRGTVEEKIKWMFHFYDINRDGVISRDEIASMIRCLYNLMGNSVYPPVDDDIKNQHIHTISQRLQVSSNKYLSYEEFYQLFAKEENYEFMNAMDF